MKDVAGKVAFVTGGASGIGLAMVRSFTGAGMKVVVADIEQSALDAVVSEFADSNAEIHAIRVDVTDRDAMAAAADEAESVFGNVHVLCNNAGVVVFGGLGQMDYKDWDWVTGVNIDGVVNGLQTFLPRLQRHGEGGHIVNTGSVAGISSIPGLGIYNATKWAVVAVSETLRKELDGSGIGVSVLCPGVVATNIGAAGRNRPDDLKTEIHDPGDLPGLNADFGALDPAIVGDMVLAAIQEDDPYIFTHPELEALSTERVAGMQQSFERWRKYRQDHSAREPGSV